MAERGLSREFGELFEIRVTFFEECVFTLLSLGHEIVHKGCIACKFHHTPLSVEFGIQSALDHSDGHR